MIVAEPPYIPVPPNKWEAEQFTGLRSVNAAQLDTVMNLFTEDQWEQLAIAFLDQFRMDILEYLDALGFDLDDEVDDSTDIALRILRRYELTNPAAGLTPILHPETEEPTR